MTGHDDGHGHGYHDGGRDHHDGGRSNAGGRRAAEEAIRLLQTLTEFTGEHDSPECRICPVCQLLAALRQVRPEAVEHLVRASAEFGAALRDLATPAPEPPTPQPPVPQPPATRPPEQADDQPDDRPPEQADGQPAAATWPAPVPERLRVQRIEVTD